MQFSIKRDVLLKFEAAVAGGIPVIKVLNEALSINKVKRVMGVMNGSCNYILTRMEESELSDESIFKELKKIKYDFMNKFEKYMKKIKRHVYLF